MALKLSVDVRESAIRQVQKLGEPVSRLVKGARKPRRIDADDVAVTEIGSEFEELGAVSLDHTLESPKVASDPPLTQAHTNELSCSIGRIIPKSTGPLKLSVSGKAVSFVDPNSLNIDRRTKVLPSDIASLQGGRSSVLIDFPKRFGKASTQGIDVTIGAVGVNSVQLDLTKQVKTKAPDPTKVLILEPTRQMTRRKQRSISDDFFDHERKLIAKNAGISDARVKWIGLFKHIPLAGTESMTVDEVHGRLIIVLKGNASALIAKQPLATVNIAMARDAVSGSILQVVVP